jgi:rhamnulokinase
MAIQQYCRETNQPAPETEGQLIRCVYESLALKYAHVLDWLQELTGSVIETIHVVGGGCRNHLLNEFTANACGKAVLAGPSRAKVLGNILVQAQAAGEIKSLHQLRAVVRDSFDLHPFEPDGKTAEAWLKARERFTKLLQRAM